MHRAKVVRKLKAEYRRLGRWQSVADIYQVNPAVVWRLVNEENYEPKGYDERRRLGLDVFAPAPVCPKCGVVHVTKRCTKKPAQVADLFAMPADELRWRMEHREEINDHSSWLCDRLPDR